MNCTWQYEDGRVCGKPADAFRVLHKTNPHITLRWYYCRRHLAAVRRMSSDAQAREHWGTETLAVTA